MGRVVDQKNALVHIGQVVEDFPEGGYILKGSQVGLDDERLHLAALIGGESIKVHLFVATLGYSRRLYVRAFRNERQESWFAGLEGAFRHFGGVPKRCCSTTTAGWWCGTTG